MLEYRNRLILAPMVRSGTLPLRLLALKYGAGKNLHFFTFKKKIRKMKCF